MKMGMMKRKLRHSTTHRVNVPMKAWRKNKEKSFWVTPFS